MKARRLLAAPVALLCASLAGAQGNGQQSNVQMDRSGTVPVYRVTVVARTSQAVNYRHRSGSTKVDFRGTALMPQAKGVANVDSKQGRIQIDAKMENLSPATQFGPEYLTYVLWAITPEGRPKNLGEVLLNGSDSKLSVTTDLQAFGLIVTAEPYFAVTQPSDVVVMENFIRTDTQGQFEAINAKYELLQRGQYVLNVSPTELRPWPMDRRTPLELFEARNAVRIARWTGADRYAAESFQKAVTSLQMAEGQLTGKRGAKSIVQNAREAAQAAEDARLIAIKRMDEERIASERRASEEREAAARRQAAQSDAERAAAERERNAAQREKAEADRAKAEADRARAEAQAAAEREARQRAEADAARASAEAQQRTAQEQAESARQAAERAEREKAELREQLRQQLNLILETRMTARGLIVNMSDVLFDFNKSTLKPGAREKLAKIAGIALAHPGLRFSVEGHTDSIGSNEYNQQLSENRAGAVREYLIAQGLPADTITSRGFGETTPVATNATAAGRQQNRRVEIVVAGEIIGIPAQK